MRNKTMAKILITGGAGFIGSHIADYCVKENAEVIILDNLSTGYMSNIDPFIKDIQFYKADIQNFQDVLTISKKCDLIFHEAAIVSVQKTVDSPIETAFINDIGTLNILEAARRNHIGRVVLASSCAIYGDDPNLPKTEDMKPNPKSPYAAQKIMGEYYARLYYDLYGLETVCLRYFNVYGPKQDPSSHYSGVISIFLKQAVQKQPPIIYGDGHQYRDFVNVQDVVQANMLAAKSPHVCGQSFNVGTQTKTSINSLWQMICDLANIKIPPIYKDKRPGDIIESLASIQLAKNVLSYQPNVDIYKGIEQTYKWYQTNS